MTRADELARNCKQEFDMVCSFRRGAMMLGKALIIVMIALINGLGVGSVLRPVLVSTNLPIGHI